MAQGERSAVVFRGSSTCLNGFGPLLSDGVVMSDRLCDETMTRVSCEFSREVTRTIDLVSERGPILQLALLFGHAATLEYCALGRGG